MGKMSFHPLIMVAIFLHIFMARFGMSAPNLTTDEAALLQLKAHISLDTHSFFSHNWNWSASASICNWVGVTCGIRHGRVTAIDLPKMGFGGTIPPHVGNLSFLVSLNITGNSFYGTLPNELLHLRRLRVVDLSSNSFSGSIPSNMCYYLTQLESFDAASNKITGELPSNLGDCRKLKRLSFAVNKITGRIPLSIGNLTELMILNLGDNNLEGEFPASIFNISSLKQLVVANNSLLGSLPDDLCPRHQSIEVFVFLNNKITGTIPKGIGNCTSLSVLILAGNQLTDEDMVAHLGDFGIAKLVDGADSVTHTMTLATIGYMAPEYGLDGIVSTSGDVYSFGILLIETFTRKKPTDKMFEGEMSLKRWVEESLPHALSEIVDSNLLIREEEEENDFEAKKVCISSIMSLALKCSADNPEERINVKDALVALKKIKIKLLKDVQQA